MSTSGNKKKAAPEETAQDDPYADVFIFDFTAFLFLL
jgi:hypothetical protein